MRRLTTARAVIDTLGGSIAVAKLTRAHIKSTYHWMVIDAFPAKTYKAMIDALEKEGCTAPASLWGMVGKTAA